MKTIIAIILASFLSPVAAQLSGGYSQSGGYNQSGGYSQSNGYSQSRGYSQSEGYSQSGGYESFSGNKKTKEKTSNLLKYRHQDQDIYSNRVRESIDRQYSTTGGVRSMSSFD